MTVLPLLGLGFFCGPLLDLTSTWQNQVPGGVLALSTLTLAMGISMLTVLENLSYTDATHLCIITGTVQLETKNLFRYYFVLVFCVCL